MDVASVELPQTGDRQQALPAWPSPQPPADRQPDAQHGPTDHRATEESIDQGHRLGITDGRAEHEPVDDIGRPSGRHEGGGGRPAVRDHDRRTALVLDQPDELRRVVAEPARLERRRPVAGPVDREESQPAVDQEVLHAVPDLGVARLAVEQDDQVTWV